MVARFGSLFFFSCSLHGVGEALIFKPRDRQSLPRGRVMCEKDLVRWTALRIDDEAASTGPRGVAQRRRRVIEAALIVAEENRLTERGGV